MKTIRFGSLAIGGALFAAFTAWAQPVTNPRTVTISPDGTGANFSSLQAAIASITDASASKPYVILAYPGIYTGVGNVNIRWKSYVSLRGIHRNSTIIRGSDGNAPLTNTPLIDAGMTEGVEISNITLDGTAQVAVFAFEESGSTNVCGARITFSEVTYIQGHTPTNPAICLSSGNQAFPGQNCTGPGSVTVWNSDMGAVVDYGGDWLISGTRLSTTTSAAGEVGYTFARARSGTGPIFQGTVTIIGSSIEAVGTGVNLGALYPVFIQPVIMPPGQIRIIGSTLHARSTVAAPTYDTSVIFPAGAGGSMLIEGSTIVYESVTGAAGGQFFGIDAEMDGNYPVDVRNSVIRSVGSGGTRADVHRDATGSPVSLAGVEYATVSGSGASGIVTANLRQGQFSADLTIPLTGPTANLDGRLFVDANDRLCYRSGGALRCQTGSIFMKVSKVGTSSAPGNLVCVTAGNKRQGRAEVTIKNRDNASPIAGATVTGNWSGATTQNGVTATTDANGNATLTSNQANPGGVFTFTVTNVTHSPDFYDSASNAETSDSTPVCN